jgi:hypothetical protein
MEGRLNEYNQENGTAYKTLTAWEDADSSAYS